MIRSPQELKSLPREDLSGFIAENLRSLTEDEALAILANPHVTSAICQQMAQEPRLTGMYNVRLRLVAHRATPLMHAAKFVHYLHWPDLVRLSVEVQVPSAVRRAIDTQLLLRVDKLTLGEKVSSARRCSSALIKVFLFDPDLRVFEALLLNQRVREDDLLLLAGSSRARAEQLAMLASDRRWSYRISIRKALALNPLTPRSTAASQLRHLSRKDLRLIYQSPATSTYLRKCIERLDGSLVPAASESIE